MSTGAHQGLPAAAAGKNGTCGSGLPKNLLFAAVAACLTMVAFGCMIGYTSPALKNLNSHPNPFHLTTEEESWIGSGITVSGMFGGLLGGHRVDRFGRYCTLISGICIFVVAWVVVATSCNFWMLLAGRMLTGFCGMFEQTAVTVCLAEVAPSAVRGRLQACMATSLHLGVLLIYLCGSQLPWNWLALVPAGILLASMLMLLWVPETPRWLMANGYPGGALEALVWLRVDQDVQLELTEIAGALKQSGTKLTGARELMAKETCRPLLICFALWMFQALSGVDYVLFYTVQIFQSTAVFLDPYYQTVLVGCSGLTGNLLAFVIIDKLGRRISLMGSGLATMVCMILLGLFYWYKHTLLSHFTWMPLACLMVLHESVEVS